MSPRTGRPKSEKPLNNDIKVRLDAETHEKLLNYCNSHKTNKAQTIRTAVIKFLDSEQ